MGMATDYDIAVESVQTLPLRVRSCDFVDRFSALPPDVRRWLAPPSALNVRFGAQPQKVLATDRKGEATSAHQAAKPDVPLHVQLAWTIRELKPKTKNQKPKTI